MGALGAEEAKRNFAAGTAKVQDFFTHLEVIPFFGIIPSAIQVIFSLGQMAYGRLTLERNYFNQGWAGFYQGGKNIVFLGCLVPCKVFSSGKEERSDFLNAFSKEQARADVLKNEGTKFSSHPVTSRLECCAPRKDEHLSW